MRFVFFAALLSMCVTLNAQVYPSPDLDAPRIQTVKWRAGDSIVLTAIPETVLTVMLEPGERIERAEISGSEAWDVSISGESDSFQVKSKKGATTAALAIKTDTRAYSFFLETGIGLMAAYVVRLIHEKEGQQQNSSPSLLPTNLSWGYKVRGDKAVRPLSIRDNGIKTVIEYAEGQSLPAVFAIGASGKEEVVDGYMREDRFIIDRVHKKLVFRVDRKKATAKRNRAENAPQ